MDPALKAAVLGANNINTPSAPNPAWASPEIAAANQVKFQLPQAVAAGNAISGQAAMDVKAQEKAAAFEQKRQAALLDPRNYQQLPKEDGGYSFLDPVGNEISAHDYARVTGQSLDKILSDSENPIDMGFLEDYNNLQEYASAKLNSASSPEAKALAESIEQSVREQFGEDLSKMDIRELIQRFQRAYPTVYGLKNTGVPVGRTFLPSVGTAEEGADVTGIGG